MLRLNEWIWRRGRASAVRSAAVAAAQSARAAAGEEVGTGEVAGERSRHSLANVLSVQARATNLLALGLMASLGTGALAWYYVHAATRASAPPTGRMPARAQTEMALPPLGPLGPADSPPLGPPTSGASGPAQAPLPPVSTPIPPAEAVVPTMSMPELMRASIPLAGASPTEGANAMPVPTTAASSLQRRLAGAVFVAATNVPGVTAAMGSAPALSPGVAPTNVAAGTAEHGELSALLTASEPVAVHARLLGAQHLLLPKGAFVDCTLETAIDSSLPGMTTCVTATDTFSADGSVVLLERGTKLVGETRGQVALGAARLFVLWTEARTPSGVIVPLDSPGTDELGRSGLAGEVDRHFWQRFGAALLITSIDGAVQAAVQSERQGAGTVVYNSSGVENMATEALRSTVDIPPTLTKHNGDRIQVLVARDVDFSRVYELRHAGSP